MLNDEYKKEHGYLFFLTGYLSQWYKIRMTDGEREYNCCEQYMMAEKALLFKDIVTYDKIMATPDPSEQKKLGREVKNFDNQLWFENCKLIVYRGNFYKFSQNLYLKKCLLETAPMTLVEVNPTDKIWAIGMGVDHPDITVPMRWQGKNFLGEVLTKVRSDLMAI